MTVRKLSRYEYMAGLQSEVQEGGLTEAVKKRLDEINHVADCALVQEKSAEIIDILNTQEPRVMTDEELMDRIRKAPIMITPAVDAVPVVHAEWKEKPYKRYPAYSIQYCSACGWEIHTSKLRASDNWNYCPHCGAKMDGDDDG